MGFWATRTLSTLTILLPVLCTIRSWTNVSRGSTHSRWLARTPRGLASWWQVTTRTRFVMELVVWQSLVLTPRSGCCALPSCSACATRSLFLSGRAATVCTYVPYGPVNEVLPYLSRRANENGGLLTKVEKEKSLLKQELIARIKGGQLFYKPEGSYTAVGH